MRIGIISCVVLMAVLGAVAPCCLVAQDQQQQQSQKKPLVLKPDLPTTMSNHRLILKDGSYQICRRYEIVGDRVRYISVERGGDWEELPTELVDWEKTRKWERDHMDMGEESPGMKEAAALDKEEAASRAAEAARTPEIVKGLELPDQEGVFALDTFHGTPELVEIPPHEADVNVQQKHGLQVVNPLAGASAHIELDGMHAKIHLHVNDPVFYVSVGDREDKENVIRQAMTVNTGNAREARDSKHGAHSMKSGFYIVHVDERKALRIVAVLHQSATGELTQRADAVRAKAQPMTGNLWLKLTPDEPLTIGEYALVEMLPTGEMSATLWDFRVDPRTEENPTAYGPIQR